MGATTINECWVLTSTDAPYFIKDASDTWFCLWGYSPAEAIGKPIDIINGPGYDSISARAVLSTPGTVRCRNTAKSGAVFEHSLTVTSEADGLLGTSKDITSVARMGARDVEVFDDDMPSAPVPVVCTRRNSMRDEEIFGDDHVKEIPASEVVLPLPSLSLTKRLSARDQEVFMEGEPQAPHDESTETRPRRASGRDGEFDDGEPARVFAATDVDELYAKGPATTVQSARDLEVFECGSLPTEAPESPPKVMRVASGRDFEF